MNLLKNTATEGRRQPADNKYWLRLGIFTAVVVGLATVLTLVILIRLQLRVFVTPVRNANLDADAAEAMLRRPVREISLGDFVLTGGEFAALAVIDAVARFVPGVLGDEESATDESFATGLLEYPQYTRPPEFMGQRVPDILLSGDHGRVDRWRREQALLRTLEKRPDLLETAQLTDEDRKFLEKVKKGQIFDDEWKK